MLIADKHYLKANLSRGWLATQSQLVQLYTNNLQSLGTMLAFVSAAAFMGIGELRMPKAHFRWTGLNFLYDFWIHSALALGVFATTQTAIVLVYGPSIALKGEEESSVIIVANELQNQRRKIHFIGVSAIIGLYFSLISNYWAKIPFPTAVTTTFALFGGAVLTISEGIRCYNKFHPNNKVYFSDIFGLLFSFYLFSIFYYFSHLFFFFDKIIFL